MRRAVFATGVVSACYLLLAAFAVLTRDDAVASSQDTVTNLTPAEIEAAVNGLVAIAVVIGVGVAALGVLSVIGLSRGRRWARVTAIVALGIAMLFSLLGLLGSGLVAAIVHLVVLVAGALALVFLLRRETADFLNRAPR